MVQRCPAVPTAPKTMAGTANFKSAVSSTIMALLPLNSSNALPRRCATISLTARPTVVEPVNETSDTRLSLTNCLAKSLLSVTKSENRPRKLFFCMTALQICWTAIAESGVLGEGFQTTVLPQIAARKAFHAQTATGKLNAEITPTTPSGCHCSYMR
ncbi:MAG: hypothetical protein ACD_45C00607G0004 [uncultured bacterium]|nr:MAG: hypothetical protein ACD_45C00607G0004 [uncultured bacterium]